MPRINGDVVRGQDRRHDWHVIGRHGGRTNHGGRPSLCGRPLFVGRSLQGRVRDDQWLPDNSPVIILWKIPASPMRAAGCFSVRKCP